MNVHWQIIRFSWAELISTLEETLKVDYKKVCGLKLFMGSSTGDMLVNNEKNPGRIFLQS